MDTVEKMASFNIVDSVSVPSILHLRGKDARVRSPQEILAACKTVRLAREGIRRSGRAGLPIINGISAASQPASMFAASYPDFGLRPSDGFLIDFLSELVVGYEALQKVAFYNSLSANIGSTSTPLFGGYAGGAEGVAVTATCYMIMGNLIFRGSYHYNAPLHSKLHLSSTRAADLGDRHVERRHRAQHGLPDGQPARTWAAAPAPSSTTTRWPATCWPWSPRAATSSRATRPWPCSPTRWCPTTTSSTPRSAWPPPSSRAPRPSPSPRSSTRCSATSSRTPTRASPSRRSTTRRTKRIVNDDYRKAMDDVRGELAAMGLEVPVS